METRSRSAQRRVSPGKPVISSLKKLLLPIQRQLYVRQDRKSDLHCSLWSRCGANSWRPSVAKGSLQLLYILEYYRR